MIEYCKDCIKHNVCHGKYSLVCPQLKRCFNCIMYPCTLQECKTHGKCKYFISKKGVYCMSSTLQICESKIGSGYWYGSQGEKPTAEFLQTLISEFGIEHYHLSDGVKAEKWLNSLQVFDCSGLIVYALRQENKIGKTEDYTAEGLYNLCPLQFSRYDVLKPGDLVFKSNANHEIVHVGIYKGNGVTVEAKGTYYGVCYGNIETFNLYGRLKFDIQNTTSESQSQSVSTAWIETVQALHTLGVKLNYPLIGTPEYWVKPQEAYKAEFVQLLVTRLFELLNKSGVK